MSDGYTGAFRMRHVHAACDAGNNGTMPTKGDVHVVPGKKGWRVEIEGSNRARSTHERQTDAIKSGRELARKNRSELLVHGRNGQVRMRNTYGDDPRKIRG